MKHDLNVAFQFVEAAGQHPDRTLLRLPESSLTYGQLTTLAVSFAMRMRRHGVVRASCIALHTQHPSVAIAGYLATGMLGCRWVHANRPSMENSQLVITHVFHDGTSGHPEQPGVIRIDQSWSSPPPTPLHNVEFEGYESPDDIWAYGQSSGTTGTPKIVPMSHRLILNRIVVNPVGLDWNEIVMSVAAPPLGLNGVAALIRTALAGGKLVLGGDYNFWQEEGVRLVVGSPTQHVKRLAGCEPPTGKKIPFARVGGAKSSREFLSMMFKYYDRIGIGYGSTESGPICNRTLEPGDSDIDDLGPAMEGRAFQVVDRDDNPVPDNTEGIVRVRAPYMANHYIGDQETTEKAFRGGWFYPGDLGRILPSGGLNITGRINDQLSIGGVKANAIVVDHVLATVPEITDGICFAEDGAHGVPILSVIVSLADGAGPVTAAASVRASCRSALSRSMVPTNVYVSDDVPRNRNGKAARHLANETVKGLNPF